MSADRIGIALKGTRNGRGWLVRCPVPSHGRGRGDHSPSLSIADRDDGGLLAKCFARCKFDDIIDSLRNLGLIEGDNNRLSCWPEPKKSIQRPATISSMWRSIWSETIDAPDTLTEKYLHLRGLALPERHEEVIRFHPSSPFGPNTRHPCMVALYRDIRTNEPKAIHRTALTSDGKKIDRKALGPKSGCAIKLTPDEDVAEGLSVAEGIETALAGMALNFRPIWALGDAGETAKFPVLSGIECLTILVDNDASGTGQTSALECSRRWTSAGREVFRVVPTAVGQDMADIIGGRAA